MKAVLAIKFHPDSKNKALIEEISKVLAELDIQTSVMARDFEKWGTVRFSPSELMRLTFEEIKKADLLITEFSEKGVGLGIEAGYAFANNKPIVIIAKRGSDISTTLSGISKKTFFYDMPEDLIGEFRNLKLQ